MLTDAEAKEQIIQITNDDVTGPHDFSPAAIEERRLRGYAAADDAAAP